MAFGDLAVGPQGGGTMGDNSTSRGRLGRSGDLIVSQLHGRFYEQVRAGNVFHAASQAATAVSVALSTTYTGIGLYNPVGSGKVLVPLLVKYGITVGQVAISSIGLIGCFATTGAVTTATTALSVQSAQIGNTGRSVAIPYAAATIVTPTWVATLLDGFTAGALSAPTPPVDLGGVFAVLPGGFLAIGALTAVTGLGWIAWEEIDAPNGL